MSVVILGLLASLGWGVSDFGGGLVSRRAPVLGVLLGSQVASLAVGLPILLAVNEPPLQVLDILISVAAGAFGAAGLALLYRGLSVGRMGVVAPVAAVVTAMLPVGFGFLTEGVPSVFAIGGIVLALTSVVLVSRAPAAPDGRPSGLWYAVGAGVLFATFMILASRLSDGLIMAPVIVVRISSILSISVWLLASRQPWRVTRSLWPALLAIGVIDMAATAAYLGAIAIGPLAIAAIIASLYPVMTTVLAALVLREQISRVHALGILAAGSAVVLIAAAGAG
jgi:drug/metabolite transporter (DMT)-like permease